MDETYVSRGNAHSSFLEDVYKSQPKQKTFEQLEKEEKAKDGKSKNKSSQGNQSGTSGIKDSRSGKELRGAKGTDRK